MATSDVQRDSTKNASARSKRSVRADDVGSLGFVGARSTFLQRRPEVLRMIVNDSESISAAIPRGPFSGTPILSSVVVARRTLFLMEEQRGVSIFRDLDGILG